MSTTTIDETRLEASMGRAVADMGAVFNTPLLMIGEKLGLFKAMAHAGPLKSDEVAERSGAAERYVREWLQPGGRRLRPLRRADRPLLAPG